MRVEDSAVSLKPSISEELEKLRLVPTDGYAGMFADATPPTLEDRLGRMPAPLPVLLRASRPRSAASAEARGTTSRGSRPRAASACHLRAAAPRSRSACSASVAFSASAGVSLGL